MRAEIGRCKPTGAVRSTVMALALALALLGMLGAIWAVAPAQAGKTVKAKTKLTVMGVVEEDGEVILDGRLTSAEKRCVGNRRVSIDLTTDTKPFRVDVDRSSRGGGWLGVRAADEFPDEDFTGVLVRASERRIGLPKGRTLVCKAKKLLFPLGT